MRNRILGHQQVARRKAAIAGQDIAAIAGEVTVAVALVKGRQMVPSCIRVHVMDRVKVVVEKQKGQRPAILDHDGARGGMGMGAVLCKRADL